jgi:lipopolysaccharide/colanic/teichoic acid biosynthesis glycosyltransferase
MKSTQTTIGKTSNRVSKKAGSLPGRAGTATVAVRKGKTAGSRLLTYHLWKGVFDRLLAAGVLIVTSPLFILIALVIKLDSQGSVIYRREQVAENGEIFTAYKFRTMRADNSDYEYKSYLVRYITEDAPYKIDRNGKAIFKVVDDPRITRFGAWLRASNLDELPQFFNVLKGEMSIIGPRPDIPFAVSMYKDWHFERLSVKPGITGLWQVQQRKRLSFDDMVRLDIEYIKKQSFLLDAKILLLTLGVILKKDGS